MQGTLSRYAVDKELLIRAQIHLYCCMNGFLSGKDRVFPNDVDCMTLIGVREDGKLLDICNELVQYGIYTTVGYARNRITALQDKKLVCKKISDEGPSKIVYLSPAMKVVVPQDGLYVMSINCESYATQEG